MVWFKLVRFVLLMLVAGTLSAFAQETTITMLGPTEAYSVGRVTYEWTDSARVERYSDDPATKRELAVTFWYPAAPTPDAQPGAYLPGLLAGGLFVWSLTLRASQGHSYKVLQVPAQNS